MKTSVWPVVTSIGLLDPRRVVRLGALSVAPVAHQATVFRSDPVRALETERGAYEVPT